MRPGAARAATAAAAGGLLAALLAAGCAGGADREDRAGGAAVRLPATDINPRPRDQVRDGGTLRWPVPELPAQWNVNHINGSKGVVEKVVQALLPYPVRVDRRAVPHLNRDVLLAAEVTRKAPKQVVTFTINPKARWSDGTPITYRDFAAQATALAGRDERFEVANSAGYQQIGQVRRGRHDRQAVVTFDRPYGDWMGLFRPLYPATTGTDPEVFNRGWLGKLPVTAGPFKVGGIDRTAKTVTLVRDPAWWGRPAKLDRIVFRAMDAEAAAGAFANGEVDALDVGNDPDAYARVRGVRGAVVRRAAGPDWRQLTLNSGREPLSDPRVRRAVAAALNRRAFAESDLAGLDWPVATLGNHFFMNTQEGYRDNSGGPGGGYDPALAGRLLDEAGWRRAGRFRARAGRPLVLDFVVAAGQPTGRREGELAQAMLRGIGVRVEIQQVPADDLFDKYVTKGDFDAVPFTWMGTPWPVMSLRSVFAAPRGRNIQQNYARTGSAAVDAAMDRAAAELDPARSRRLLNEADRLVWEQYGVLPLYQRPHLVAARADLANVGARGFTDPTYEDIGFTR